MFTYFSVQKYLLSVKKVFLDFILSSDLVFKLFSLQRRSFVVTLRIAHQIWVTEQLVLKCEQKSKVNSLVLKPGTTYEKLPQIIRNTKGNIADTNLSLDGEHLEWFWKMKWSVKTDLKRKKNVNCVNWIRKSRNNQKMKENIGFGKKIKMFIKKFAKQNA